MSITSALIYLERVGCFVGYGLWLHQILNLFFIMLYSQLTSITAASYG